MNSASLIDRIDHNEFKVLVEKNVDGVILVDGDGIVMFVNPAAEQIFGRPADQIVGTQIGIPIVAGETTEITVRRSGGDYVNAEVRAIETTWGGRPACLASLRDVSARKAMEENLRHSAKMEAVGRLTAGIAHDFNNLLTVVLGNLEHAQSLASEPKLRRTLENATRGAQRAATLTERLLAFARRKPLEPRVVRLDVLVTSMSDLLKRTLGESVSVETTISDDSLIVEVDPAELEVALLNLAVNARDAMPGGGQLSITTSAVDLERGRMTDDIDVKPGRYACIAVTDTGCGIAPEVLKHVFEPFFTTKPGGHGTGLGLSQVYGFVKQSGGHVDIDSKPGAGTTIRIYLPHREGIVSSAWPLPEAAVENPPRGGVHECILVVEDDEDVRNYGVSSLRRLGYTVLEAEDAVSALETLRRERVDLLFTDLGLPGGKDGRFLADEARKLKPSLKMLITTAYAGDTVVHQGRLDAGIELLSKPFSVSALATRVRELLDRGAFNRTPRVLVVDDEVLLRMFIADVLSEAGYLVEEAGSFAEVLSHPAREQSGIDGAVIDIGLPDRSGEELIPELRKSTPHLPIVLATGFSDEQVGERYAREPRIAVLTKPFKPEALIAVLNELGVRLPPAL